MTSVSKTFPGTRALVDVSFRVAAGEVATLIGHNGSGKSTLIKVMSGYHKPDELGEGGAAPSYQVDGEEIRFGDPDAVRRAGVRFIHQDLGLIDGLTVLENMRLGRGLYTTSDAWRIHWRREQRDAASQLQRLNLTHISPKALVGDLTVLAKTEVAIARAVAEEQPPRVLVLDEPTAALPDVEVTRLFRLVRTLTEQGTAVVYVSHRLEEILEIGNTVTALRDGRVVATGEASGHDISHLARLVAGADVERAARSKAVGAGNYALRFEDVHSRELRGASFGVGPGEVIGVAGLAGSGVHAIPEVLLGLSQKDSGSIYIGERELTSLGAGVIAKRGLVALPAPKALKSIQTMTVRENLTLADLRPFWKRALYSTRAERAYATETLVRAGVRPADPERVMNTLSGGNQQKVVLAKWLRTEPEVLVLDEPVQGVDVSGRSELMAQLREAAERGLAVVLCSSDFDDLAEVCSRVVIMARGRVIHELNGEEVTRSAIVDLSYG